MEQRVLFIQASPRGERSHSLAVAWAFVEAYQERKPQDVVQVIDLFRRELPAMDGLTLKAKYNILHGRKHSAEEKEAWTAVEAVIQEFLAADKYVLAVPMWNFHLPYRLKHYLDVILQPGYTFGFDAEKGYYGLVTGKPVFLACARGGEYPPGSSAEGFDFQTRYLEMILGFIGVSDLRKVIVEPMLGAPDTVKARQTAAIEQARELARTF